MQQPEQEVSNVRSVQQREQLMYSVTNRKGGRRAKIITRYCSSRDSFLQWFPSILNNVQAIYIPSSLRVWVEAIGCSQQTKLTADQPSMATYLYTSRCPFNTTQRTFSSSNMNFYYVFHLILILDCFPLLLVKVELVEQYCCYCLSISLQIDPLLILSTDHINFIKLNRIPRSEEVC